MLFFLRKFASETYYYKLIIVKWQTDICWVLMSAALLSRHR